MGLVLYVLVVLLPVLFKIFMKFTTKWDRSYTCLVGKTVLVTGANTGLLGAGIGFHTAQDFAKRGAKVILACRNKERAEEARTELIKLTGNNNIHVTLVDFGSLKSVRNAARELQEQEERLDILVNNAGLAGLDKRCSEDGLQLLMQTNHFGPLLFTLLLLGLLKKSTPSRIVNLTSTALMWHNLKPDNLNNFVDGFVGKTVNYATTKICNHLFTMVLAKRLQGTGVDVNSVHPGTVDTNIFKKLPKSGKLVADFMRLFFMTVPEGAQTTIHVAVSKNLKGHSGEFFVNCKPQAFPLFIGACRDEEVSKKVWSNSLNFVGLKEDELSL